MTAARVLAAAALAALLPAASSPAAPIDPRLRAALARGESIRLEAGRDGTIHPVRERFAPADAAGRPEERVALVLLGAADSGALAALGARVRTRAGDAWTVEAPIERAAALARLPGVRRVGLPAPYRPLLDLSLVEANVPGLRERSGDGWSGWTGDGVVVGFVDTGVDARHEDFLGSDGKTRILHYWAQGDSSGAPPAEIPGARGTEWPAAWIDAGGATAPDSLGHGTHVAGIAAGSGRAAASEELRYAYPGVAPDAGIVAVQVVPTEDNILDAVRYVFAKADALGRPAVVNLSLGSQFGPHDGTTPLERGIEALVGPGRLVVAAAGNEGDDWIHAEIVLAAGGADSAEVSVAYLGGPDPDFNFLDIDAFYDEAGDLDVTVVTPAGARLGPHGLGASIPDAATPSGTVFLVHDVWADGSATREVFLEVSDTDPAPAAPGRTAAPPPAAGRWRLVFRNPGGVSREVDLWVAAAYPMHVAWETGHDPDETLSAPATGRGVVSVGSFNSRRCWPTAAGSRCSTVSAVLTAPGKLTWFSSRGPTRDGRPEPDLVAPGFVVAAARSSQLLPDWESLFGVPLADITTPDERHMVQAGTSMAAPHVTGALALALQADPGLDPGEAAARLAESARIDEFTGSPWNAGAGNGKLDAGRLIQVVPVWTRALGVTSLGDGGMALVWEAGIEDPVTAFRLERERHPVVTELARLSGGGPHRFEDRDGRPGDRYRLWGRGREGSEFVWAEAVAPARRALLGPAIPSPFRERTRVLYSPGAGPGPVTLDVLDARGARVRELSAPANAGEATWDGRDARGREAPAGLYWVRLRGRPGAPPLRVVRLP